MTTTINTNASEMYGPIKWDICGSQNNWNWNSTWTQTRSCTRRAFPPKHLALVYKGADASAPLLATIKTTEHGSDAGITYSGSTGASEIGTTMKNLEGECFSDRWPIKVQALEGRELHWSY
ncbi:hypothetical protein MMC13_006619 [Lambiella insularis]|nr:hypothetical protein [Lambiella insularis]